MSDKNPGFLNITRNSSIYNSSEYWNNGSIIIPIDGLRVGHYIFTIHISDQFVNTNTDTVEVIVTEVEKNPSQSSSSTTSSSSNTSKETPENNSTPNSLLKFNLHTLITLLSVLFISFIVRRRDIQ